MQYYTFALDDKSKDLITIVMPFGKYQYNILPIGLKCSPDFAQETIGNIFRDVEDAEVYIDNIGAFSNNWEHHVKLLSTVFTMLQDSGFMVNPLKCEWVVNTNRPQAVEEESRSNSEHGRPIQLKTTKRFHWNGKLLP